MRLNDHDHQILVRMPTLDDDGQTVLSMLTVVFEKASPETLYILQEDANSVLCIPVDSQDALAVVSGIATWLSLIMSQEEQKPDADDGH